MAETIDTVIGITEIQKLLPHRYPFLLVDRVVEHVPGESITAIKNVTINEPFFQGHFPGLPVMPGMLILEALAQAGGILVSKSLEGPLGDRIFMFTGVEKAKFRKPVVPGDVVEYHMRKTSNRRFMWWFKGEAKVNGVLVAEAEIGAMLVTE